MVTKLIAVTTLQYIQISNHYIVRLKLICQLDTVFSKEKLIIPTSQGYCVNDNDNNSNKKLHTFCKMGTLHISVLKDSEVKVAQSC